MSETTTPEQIRDRRRARAEAEGRSNDKRSVAQPQDHKPKAEKTEQASKPQLVNLSKPITMTYLGQEFLIYPKAFDDFSQVERAAGIELDAREVDNPSPGFEALKESGAEIADMWDTTWRFLGWGTISDEEVKEEYAALRSAIYEEYGYCSAQLMVNFAYEANEQVTALTDPEGNSKRSRTS